MVQLFTVGHGTSDEEELGGLLTGAGIQALVDVRRYPASRRNPAVATDALARWLPAYGIAYRWEERLGGRRRSPDGPSPDTWWRHDSFRSYAAWSRQDDFRAALQELLAAAEQGPTAVMCSESVWWRCHRRLIADVAVLRHGVDVQHLMPDGRLTAHPVAEGARLTPDGVVWDGG